VTYEVVHGWPILPNGHALGQAVGVGVDSRGRVFVFHRAGRQWSDPFPTDCIPAPTVVVFDGGSGDQLAQWGGGLFVMPHGLTVDHDDNVWTTDVGLHTVSKLTGTGQPLLTVGTRAVPGNDETHFALPTDVAVLPDGGFYVSDGYGNARVARFDASGRFAAEFGARGAGPGQFDLPHGIALDAAGHVYVADRGNARIQIFDAGGRFLHQWKSEALGRPYGIAIGADAKAYVVDGGDQPASPPDRSRAMRLDREGTIEATFGRFGHYDGQFNGAHAVAVGADGAVYVVDAFGMRVQKFLPRARGAPASAVTRDAAGAASRECLPSATIDHGTRGATA
jgi:peptidylamidoglycolate lyase